MKNKLTQFSHDWPIIVTDYSSDARKVFEVSGLDRVICGIINKTENKEISFEDLGLLLGLGTRNLVEYSETIKFYKDPAEVGILNKIIQSCQSFNLVEVEAETARIKITEWGLHALKHKEKYQFWKCTLSSYKFTNLKLAESAIPFPYFDLGLAVNVRQESKYKAPYSIAESKSRLTHELSHALTNSDQSDDYRIDDVIDSEFSSKRVVSVKLDVTLYDDQTTLAFSHAGKQVDGVSVSIALEENSDLRSYLQRKGLYTYLLSQDNLLSPADLAPYVADDFFDPVSIIGSGMIDWHSEEIFEFFTAGLFSDHTVWAAVTEVCPIKLLIQNANFLQAYISWPTLTERASSDEILSNVSLDWDVELVLEAFSEEDTLAYLDNKLAGVSSVASKGSYAAVADMIPYFLWEVVTEKLSDSNLEKYLFEYPLSFTWLTTNKEELCKRVLIEKDKWTNDVFSRKWDWQYISKHYDIDFLSRHFRVFEHYLGASSLFLRIAKDRSRLIRFLKSKQTNFIKEKLATKSFKLSNFHEVFLDEETLALLESHNLLAWWNNGVDGIETHPSLIWTDALLKSYGQYIQAESTLKLIAKKLDSIQTAIKNPTFDWDWTEITNHYDYKQVLSNWLLLEPFIDSDEKIIVITNLSEKISLPEALSFSTAHDVEKQLAWELIFDKSSSQDIEKAYTVINESHSAILTEAIVAVCTHKVSLSYILEHENLSWDWILVTRDKILPHEIGEYFNTLASRLDWVYIIKNIYSEEQLNDLDFLHDLAGFIDERDDPVKQDIWKYITETTAPDKLWRHVDATNQSPVFHWDWSVISASPIFLKGHIEDLRNGYSAFFIDNADILDWPAITENAYFVGFLERNRQFDDIKSWSSRVRRLIDPIVKYVDWAQLSANKHLTKDTKLVKFYYEYWDWIILSTHSSIITKRAGKNIVLDLSVVRRFKDVLDFYALSSRNEFKINRDFVVRYGHKNLNWHSLSTNLNYKLSWDVFFENGEPGESYIRDAHGQSILDKPWDFGAMSKRNDIEFTAELIYRLSDKSWDWAHFSAQSFITKDLVLDTLQKDWSWIVLSKNNNLVFSSKFVSVLYENDTDERIDWFVTSSHKYFIVSRKTFLIFSKKTLQTLNWTSLSESESLSSELLKDGLLDQFSVYWDWNSLVRSKKVDLSLEVLSNYSSLIPSATVSDFILPDVLAVISLDEIKERLDWDTICRRDDLKSLLSNLDFISKNKQYLDWSLISEHVHIPFTEELINTYYSLWNWSVLKSNPTIVEDHKLYLFVENCIETDARLSFLDKISQQDSSWSGYIYHFTSLPNAIKVLNSSSILSRDSALAKLDNFDDAAGSVVSRRDVAHAYARFYFRPQTPTQFYNEELGQDQSSTYEKTYQSALRLGLPKCPVPVFFRFRLQDILFDSSIEYKVSNGNMQTNRAKALGLEKAVRAFDFDGVYSIFPNFREYIGYNSFDRVGFDQAVKKYIDKSQQEFLIKDQFNFSGYSDFDIIVKDEHVRSHLLDLLEDEKLKKKVIADNIDLNIFHYGNRKIRVDKDGGTIKVKTDYENDHKIKLIFGEPFKITNADGCNVTVDVQSIEFEQNLTVTLQKEIAFKVEFYDDLKEQPWEVISMGDKTDDILPHQSLSLDITSENLSADEVLQYLKESYPYVKTAFERKIRHYQLGHHTLLVMGQFEKYFAKSDLPVSKHTFLFMLALHDVGKAEAFAKGDKSNQYFYTKEFMNVNKSSLPFSNGDFKICVALVGHDPIGEYFQGAVSVKLAAAMIRDAAQETNLAISDFFKLQLIYYQCDTGSYTEDAGGYAFLEYLFQYQGNDKVFNDTENRLMFSAEVEAKLFALRQEIRSFTG